ncbi:hypothetical protein V495_01760 [Pseudogymnoascus sp. VKM F-4514 (FW-929)]|nr:hypothetical protein V495_01760 [Pseudogymnoascus sp. VKM F-4514 (FW-929)]KFY59252.1 hypothetical protein V497_04405 [Pseudogymnoascus sp. VKM F-4516 (FW-969)]
MAIQILNTTAPEKLPSPTKAWWKEASVYQIYPASFCDKNGDGFGDISGIISKLDYLKELGVDVVWLCPVYESPQADMGYDISNYCAIDSRYGTMGDIDALTAGLHERGMKFVMDLVVNHTSDQHNWFRESKSSRDNAKRDWYIWRDPRFDSEGNRLPPNNWASIFGGSAWSFDDSTEQYYLHLFCHEQPDLNWDTPEVVLEVEKIMRFWLDKGVDGFRMDVINLISKVPGFPDAPIAVEGQLYQPAHVHYACGPRLHEHLRVLRSILDEYDAFAVGEMPWAKDEKQVMDVVTADRKELNMIFQFDIVDMDNGQDDKFGKKDWDLVDLKKIVEKWQTSMYERGGWNALFLENHDQSRSVSRFASDEPQFREYAAKMLATFISLQSGTLFVYQGQELGMANMPKDWSIEEYKDVETQNYWKSASESFSNDKEKIDLYMKEIHLKARDHARTPIQWNSQENAGFTSAVPWMRVNPDYAQWNAADQVHKAGSVYTYWQALLRTRKLYKNIFVYGSFEIVDRTHQSVFCYRRTQGHGACSTVVLNFSKHVVDWTVPSLVSSASLKSAPLIHNYDDGVHNIDGMLRLRPYEALVWVEGGVIASL